MKHPVILALAALFVPSLSHAVTVSNCPEAISVKLSNISVISAEKLRSMLSVMDNEDGTIEAFRQSLERTNRIETAGGLEKAEKARCEYKVTKNSAGPLRGAELVLATSHGKDWLRIRLPSDKGIIGGYITVTGYGPDGLETDGKVASLGYDDPSHQGNLQPGGIAFARSVEAR